MELKNEKNVDYLFYFDFSAPYVGCGLICPHIINCSVLFGAVLSSGLLWPFIIISAQGAGIVITIVIVLLKHFEDYASYFLYYHLWLVLGLLFNNFNNDKITRTIFVKMFHHLRRLHQKLQVQNNIPGDLLIDSL
ncbi:YELLOW STRIPE like 6 [Artemisia annua]|uniref:YELLOW STRIPE like 6 n=1 Tax=Artemisia annua TaxID=35608 RepID=A0A2U1LUY7_ARTAN|nr:YELLOW STRIPE like 6 [Artemisia annua]